MLFNSSKLQDPPTSLSICQTTVVFSDSVRNLGFYLDKDISLKEHINFICKTAFFELRRISTIRHYLSIDATITLVVSLVLSRIDYCNSLLAGLPLSLISKLQRIQNCAARLCSPYILKCTHHTISQAASLVTRQNRISYKIACLCFNAINYSTPAYLSDLLHLKIPDVILCG